MQETVTRNQRQQSHLLVERDAELNLVSAAVEKAAKGNGRLLVIEGAAGMGKSRLLSAAAEIAGDAGFIVLRAAGGEREREYPAGVILDLFEVLVAAASEQERDALFRRAAESARPLFDADGTVVSGGAAQHFALLHGLYWFLVNLSERTPVALVVDDLQWADDFSARFLTYVANRLSALPVVLLTSVWPGNPGLDEDLISELHSADGLAWLRLPPLSAEAVALLADERAHGSPAPAGLVERILRQTGGNPFLVAEVVAGLDAPATMTSGVDTPEIEPSPSVERSVLRRIRRLGSCGLVVARSAAVLGGGTSLEDVARVARLDIVETASVAEKLRRCDILATTNPVTFTFPLLETAILLEMPTEQRLETHRRVASALFNGGASADIIAGHLIVARASGEGWVRTVFEDAARLARSRGSAQLAVRYLRRALEQCPHGNDHSRLSLELAMAEAAAGEPASVARFVDALSQISDPAERAQPLFALGHELYRRGRYREAADTFRDGAVMFADSDAEMTRRFESAYAACGQFLPSERPEVLLRLAHVTRGVEGAGDANRRLLDVRVACDILYASGRPPLSTLSFEGTEAAFDLGNFGTIETGLAMVTAVWRGQAESLLLPLDRVRDHARAVGDVPANAEASFIRALALHSLGEIAEAMSAAEQAQGWGAWAPLPQAILADCLLMRGDTKAAESVVRVIHDRLDDLPAPPFAAWYHWARARCELANGLHDEALAHMTKAGHILEGSGITNPAILSWRADAALAAHAIGDTGYAGELIEAELRLAERFHAWSPMVHTLRARAATEPHEVAIATLREAELLASRAGTGLDHGFVLADLGVRLRHNGQVLRAREDLRRALEIACRVGAQSLAERIREELRAAGARPRRDRLTGIQALTPTEDRIARMVASGRSNRLVAESLFLTKNTVEWHLRNVYRKLEIKSRQELNVAFGPSRKRVQVIDDRTELAMPSTRRRTLHA